MQGLADSLHAAAPGLPLHLVYGATMLACCLGILGFFSVTAGVLSWAERRIAARIQSRIGPNRVGPQGFLQWIADGLKTFLKEDMIPEDADAWWFRIAPYFVFVGVFCTFVVLPFSSRVVIADLNIGILFVMAITSLVVVGLIMAGWASNNKWSVLGGMRSAAQIVSYEIPAALALLTPIMIAGTLSTQGMIAQQGWFPTSWIIFHNPFAFVAFWVYLVAATAEGNRAPFDLPEAESELVSGYNTEYSGMRFLFFFFAEWANLFVIGAVATIAFLGGWQAPPISDNPWIMFPLEAGAFLSKAFLWVFVLIWVRWTLPRIRVDQLMDLCWKYLVPIAFFCLVGNAFWMVIFDGMGIGDMLFEGILRVIGL